MTTTDLDAWIDGAQRTHRSITIYQRADLVAQLDDIQRRIQIEADALEGGADGARDRLDGLEERWVAVAQEYSASALTFTLRGLTVDEIRAIRDAGAAENLSDDEIGVTFLQASIVDPPVTVAQLYRLREKIGDPQIDRLSAGYAIASRVQPPVPSMTHGDLKVDEPDG